MVKLTFIHPDGTSSTIDGREGSSVMLAALAGSIPGILAECGGQLMCATCHVYVEETAADYGPLSDDEDAMLEGTVSERLPNSRLSCQLELDPNLGDLTVRIPPEQV